jgi:hypothetical protein
VIIYLDGGMPRWRQRCPHGIVADTRDPHDVVMLYGWDRRHRGGTVTNEIGTAP